LTERWQLLLNGEKEMVVAILSLLGVPLWLTLGWLAAAIWHRHEVKQLPGVFKLKVRIVEGEYRHIDGNFSRTGLYGLWAHDVLIVEKGLFLGRNLHFPVSDRIQEAQPADPDQVKRLGENPTTFQFLLDNRAIIEVAAAKEDEERAMGPFAAEES
jgi:hypothetical protein